MAAALPLGSNSSFVFAKALFVGLICGMLTSNKPSNEKKGHPPNERLSREL